MQRLYEVLGTSLGAEITFLCFCLWDNENLKKEIVCILQAQTLRYNQQVWPWRVSRWRDIKEHSCLPLMPPGVPLVGDRSLGLPYGDKEETISRSLLKSQLTVGIL